MQPSKTWKQRERQVGIYWGLPSAHSRTPLSGGNSGITRSDTLHPVIFAEHKHRKRNAWVSLWDKVKSLAANEDKIPVLTMSVKGRPGFWIMCHSSDLIELANQRIVARREGAE